MADTKLTALTEITAPPSTDLVYVVTDPSGTPDSRKCLVKNLLRSGYAQIYVDDGSSSQTLSAATWTKLTQFTTNFASSVNATADQTNNKLTLDSTGFWLVYYSISCTTDISGDIEFALFWNATQINGTRSRHQAGDSAAEFNCFGVGLVDATSAGQDLDLRSKIDETGGGDVYVIDASIVANRLDFT